MKKLQFILLAAIFLTLENSLGICPTTPIRSFDAQGGFKSVVAYKDDKTGMTQFRIFIEPKTFLSHFKHGFAASRAQARITLRPKDGENFKGVSAQLGKLNDVAPDFEISFEVPSVDLVRYELEFYCSISQDGDLPVIGGEIFIGSLADLRNANETITEASPIWQELEEEHQKMRLKVNVDPGTRSMNSRSHGWMETWRAKDGPLIGKD